MRLVQLGNLFSRCELAIAISYFGNGSSAMSSIQNAARGACWRIGHTLDLVTISCAQQLPILSFVVCLQIKIHTQQTYI